MIKREKELIFILSIFLITLLIIFLYFFQIKDYYAFFWICWAAILGMSIGLILKNPSVILGQLIIILIPDMIWTIDFILSLFIGKPPFGVVEPFMGKPFSYKVISFQHMYTPLLGLIAFFKLKKIKKNSFNKLILPLSLVEVFLFFFITLIIIPSNLKVNCLYLGCGVHSSNLIERSIIWGTFMGGSTLFSYYLIKFFSRMKN